MTRLREITTNNMKRLTGNFIMKLLGTISGNSFQKGEMPLFWTAGEELAIGQSD